MTADVAVSRMDHALGGLLLDEIAASACVVDRDHRCVYANRAWLEAHGQRSDDVVGRSIHDLARDTAARHALSIERALRGERQRLEGWIDDGCRGRRYLEETFVPYAGVVDAVEAVAIFGRDQTDLKLREQELAGRIVELQASEALKSAIVDHALVALISTDADGRIVEFNPSAESMFGYGRAAVLGRPVSEIVIPARFRAMHEAGMQRMDHGGPPRVLGKRLEMHAMREDRSEFPIEMVLWRTTVGGTAFYTASIVDLTESKAAAREIDRQRESLRQTEKLGAMGSLLAGVAHELNNPLAIVMGRAAMLEECCEETVAPDLVQVATNARLIHEAADRCGRIVRTFLDMARRRPPRLTAVGLNDLVRAALEMLQYGYRTHDIVVDTVLCEGLPTVEADGDQIGQIVMNLLVNAQQVLTGIEGPRRVRVQTGIDPRHADDEAPRVWLQIADNGPGVDAALRGRIFEAFFTTKPEGSGTGLGLAMSRSMAREHGGDLMLDDDAPGTGASFRLHLPIVSRAATAGAPVVASPPRSGRAARVLVVDDEPDLAMLMRDLLEAAGHEVETAASGTAALRSLASAHFDAIVSDLRMPDMDGATLWRAVSVDDPALARRMLFVTGDTLSPDANRFLTTTGCAALDKPFAKSDLLAAVASLLTASHAVEAAIPDETAVEHGA